MLNPTALIDNSRQGPTEASVSVIVPAHNEEGLIGRCISSVQRTGWPSDRLEVVVVDHQSTDATATVARLAGARVIHQTRDKKIGGVRNAGLSAANGQVVAYVDADCTVPDTWLRSAISILMSDERVGAVGGPCLSPSNGTWVERCLAPTRLPPGIIRPAMTLATSSLVVRTALLNELGGFNETLISGEDDDISNRIRQRGLSLVSANDCHIVHHGYPRTLRELLKKEIWHGSNHIDVRSGLDLTLLLTFVFLLATAAIPALLIAVIIKPSADALLAFAAAVALQFVPPFLFAVKRLRQSIRDWLLALPLLAVGYAYFMGHGLGVIANFRRRVLMPIRNCA